MPQEKAEQQSKEPALCLSPSPVSSPRTRLPEGGLESGQLVRGPPDRSVLLEAARGLRRTWWKCEGVLSSLFSADLHWPEREAEERQQQETRGAALFSSGHGVPGTWPGAV